MNLALIGNPNCGKTALFNRLTGANQHVGNFPGVTVERKTGVVKGIPDCTVTDLPGIYSLRPYSGEEIVTRDFLVKSKPDVVVNIVDATNPERNLYLTVQLLEYGIPIVVALNMMDEVRSCGGKVDVDLLSDLLGVPVVPLSATKNEGIGDLLKAVQSTKTAPRRDKATHGAVRRCLLALEKILDKPAREAGVEPFFAAVRWLEEDKETFSLLKTDDQTKSAAEQNVGKLEEEYGMDRHAALADMRYEFVGDVCKKTISKGAESKEKRRSRAIDKVLTHKIFALPIFFVAMFVIFYLTFQVIGYYASELIALGIDKLSEVVQIGMENANANPVLTGLVIDGVFHGVGTVLSFLPYVVVLFFFLSVLEDSGYMARIAFVTDRLLRQIGLSGKSIVPMLIGFGCTVPAVMSTRTLTGKKDRTVTTLLLPFMSCSAKIPIYALFTAAFFPKYKALVMMSLYIGGILIGLLFAFVMKKTAFKGKNEHFIMELPNYRLPEPKSVLLLMWEKAKEFLIKAFTVIFLTSMIVWVLQTFNIRFSPVLDHPEDSILAAIGNVIAPVFSPCGFGNWQSVSSLIVGFTAKETVVSTLEVLTGDASALFTPISAYSFMIFTLLYTPCVAAVTTIRKETGSVLLTIAIVVFQCVLAWAMSAAVYQILLALS